MKTIAVAMSGGVDSSVAAALLKEQGHRVFGIMLRLWTADNCDEENRCCSPDAIHSARRVAELLDIPFHVLDAREIFHAAIVEPLIQSYGSGKTPNPCAACNRIVRWGFLLKQARAMGADYLATGHYANVISTEGVYQLHRGADRKKDQSYMLSGLGQQELRQSIFPLGGTTKKEVRSLAEKFKLPVADKPDSQDLCFLPDGDYRGFLRRYAPETQAPGEILDWDGKVIGRHAGIGNYTIGQRKGIPVASPVPLYVLEIDAQKNSIRVGPKEYLGHRSFIAENPSWVAGDPPSDSFIADVKIRYASEEVPAAISCTMHSVTVLLSRPLRDITPGQVAVFYQQENCLGNAIIEEARE